MIEVGAHACTDITGFGLIGHAIELGAGARATVRLEASAVPWMAGLAPYVDKRFMCGGLHRNREYAEGRVRWSGGTEEQHLVISDPQTSGGLLIAVAPEKLADLLAAMEQRGVETRAVVGEVVARDGDVDVEVV
jgi:selenide,water dikinase